MTWTDARIALISRLWADGVSASRIAETLGDVSRSAVLGKLQRLNLLGSRLPASAPRRYEGPAPASSAPAPAPPPVGLARGLPPVRAPDAPPMLSRSAWCEAAFTPLAGTSPRAWLTRDFGECAFPVGGEGEELLSCCAPARPRSAYCAAHHGIVFRTVRPVARAAEPRRWADLAERFAA